MNCVTPKMIEWGSQYMDARQNLDQTIVALGDPFIVAVQVPLRAANNQVESAGENSA